MVFLARQSFQFLRQNTLFLENNRAFSKFLYVILHYLISITIKQRSQCIKSNFILITRAILMQTVGTRKKCA